jgi:hypothetical protein
MAGRDLRKAFEKIGHRILSTASRNFSHGMSRPKLPHTHSTLPDRSYLLSRRPSPVAYESPPNRKIGFRCSFVLSAIQSPLAISSKERTSPDAVAAFSLSPGPADVPKATPRYKDTKKNPHEYVRLHQRPNYIRQVEKLALLVGEQWSTKTGASPSTGRVTNSRAEVESRRPRSRQNLFSEMAQNPCQTWPALHAVVVA